MQKIYHKRNELLEVEFFKDKECTKAFDFTNAKDLYIDLKVGELNPFLDITPFLQLYPYTEFCNLYLPYFPNVAAVDFLPSFENIYTLDDITPNLSKYIPEDNAVLFLSSEDCETYYTDKLTNTIDYSRVFVYPKIEHRCNKLVCTSSDCTGIEDFTKLTIFLHHGTQSELQKANQIAKELKEKYGVEEVNVFVLHCFVPKRFLIKTIRPSKIDRMYDNEIYGYKMQKICNNINKIITTNSTSILEPQDNEKLQVIDCFDIFNNAL
jgi:hypothetical protein